MKRLGGRAVFLILLAMTAGLLLAPPGMLSTWRLSLVDLGESIRRRFAGTPERDPSLERTRAERTAERELADLRRRHAELRDHYDRTRAELAETRRLVDQIAELRTFAESLRFTVARTTARFREPDGDVIVIDRGARDGVGEGDPVLQGQSALGRVVETAEKTSRVALLTHRDMVVPARLGLTGLECYARGDGGGACRIIFLGARPEAKEGDLIFTSGLLGYFPPDLVVGELSEAPRRIDQGRTSEAELVPRARLDAVEYVLVVRRGIDMPVGWRPERSREEALP